uniref:Gametogenetin-binding protein 2 n=1 Tax=Globisporangium ultimum (strain ATCC 200006 / CBS 805.95 / DAOM BR144) TaxID=431595 RepID=K3WJZ7_GLOUD
MAMADTRPSTPAAEPTLRSVAAATSRLRAELDELNDDDASLPDWALALTAASVPLASKRQSSSSTQSSSVASTTSSGKECCESLHGCQCQPTPAEAREFRKRWLLLTDHERTASLRGDFNQFLQTTNELLPCLGCRNSTEELFQKLMEGSCKPSPLIVSSGLQFENKKPKQFQLNDLHMTNSDASLTLFLHQERWGNTCLSKISRSSKGTSSRARCPLHSQRARGRPRPAAFEALWNKLPDEHQRELSHIDSDQFLTDLESYLRRHRFCCRCKEKVLEAYDLLIGSSCSEDDCEDCAGFDCADKHHEHSDYGDELHYTSYLFDELTFSRTTSHIVVPCHIDFMSQLMSRADQEIVGDWGDRHARTIAEAQDEVLICLGMVIWEKMQTLWTQLRTEKRSEELLVHCAVSTLRRNFDVAVEALHGMEMMEQLLAEEDDESRRLAKKKEKKKEKKKKRKSATKQKQVDKSAPSEPTKGSKTKRLSPQQKAGGARNNSQTRSSSSLESQSSSQDDGERNNNDSEDSTVEGSSDQNQPHQCTSTCDDVCSFKTLSLDEQMEMQLLSSMGWDASNQFASSLPELDGDSDDEENYGIPEDEIEFWKQNRTSLVRKRLAQRQKLQEKFDQFVLRTNSLEAN